MTLIPESEFIKRRDALKWAEHQLRLSGLRPSAFAVSLFERFARGEITHEDVRAALLQHYRRD